jgi:hypothetical protein
MIADDSFWTTASQPLPVSPFDCQAQYTNPARSSWGDPALAGIIDRLGGSGELMTRLGQRGNNGIPAGYMLITSSDPDFINNPT